jgi:hypothetical protein
MVWEYARPHPCRATIWYEYTFTVLPVSKARIYKFYIFRQYTYIWVLWYRSSWIKKMISGEICWNSIIDLRYRRIELHIVLSPWFCHTWSVDNYMISLTYLKTTDNNWFFLLSFLIPASFSTLRTLTSVKQAWQFKHCEA